ncbi:isochorismatase family protein [Vibrio mangrovi]|uniref:isochorismatase n=1 Tax=Vibrio mangrovi TaxID=474394 RepID=A0A1Y6IWS5_9VIBR|nr:isochorismatase family protein [Vibrio mangrovi]MDW6003038.1 isochorismatase family protein [Vibrio mangrovi]SMS01280.1 Isochorismatase [Vibrio mangrovi]
MTIARLTDYSLPQLSELPLGKVDWKLDNSRAALLIHDMQDYFVNFWPQDSQLITQVIHNLVTIRTYCRANGIPVFYTAQPARQHDEERGLLNDMWGQGLPKAPEQKNIVAALTPEHDDVVLTKWRYSAFFRSDLAEQMADLGRDQLIIGGVYAHIGCLTTANEAFMRNIQPFMVSDALADFSRDEHLMALHYTLGRCGRVVDTQEVVTAITTAEAQSEGLPASFAALRHEILPLLDDEDADEIENDDNLIDYGLDSIHIMNLASRWNPLAPQINFMELAKTPTLHHWWQLMQKQVTTTGEAA